MRSYCRPLSDPWLRAGLPGLSSFRIFRRQCRRFVRQSNLPRTTPKRNSPTNYATTTFDRFYFFALFFFFFFEYSFIYIYVSSNEERGYVSMIRELDSDPLSTDHFNFRTLTSSTFNPFAGAKLKNFESWDGMGKNRRLKSLLQLIIYKFSLDFSLFKRLEKLVCCSK